MPRAKKSAGAKKKTRKTRAKKSEEADTASAATPKATTTTKATTTSKKKSVFDQADEYLKKSGTKLDDEVILDLDMLKRPLPHLPTGSLIVDFAIGGRPNRYGILPCPGLPKGRVTEIFGLETSGKTTLALTAAATTCLNGGTVGYVDYEHEVVPDYAHTLGVPINDRDKFRLYQPESLEDGLKRIALMIKSGVDLIVIDSVGAATPVAALDMDKKTQMGLLAAQWSKWLPALKVAASKSGTTILGIAQMRSSMSSMGSPWVVQGGNVWKYVPALRLDLKIKSQEKGKVYNPATNSLEDQTVGGEVEIRLAKCKVSRSQQHRYSYFLRWGEGIDDFRSCFEIAKNHNIITQAASWFSWARQDGTTTSAQGLDKMREAVMADPKAWDELQEVAIQCLSKTSGKEIVVEDESSGEDEDLDSLMRELDED